MSQGLNKKELFLEYSKCIKEPAYAIESYFKTFDMTQNGYVPFVLFPKQKNLLNNYDRYRYNLVLKYRQAGISTVTAAYLAIKLAFANPNKPERVLILANKQETSMEFLKKIMDFIKQLPSWVGIDLPKQSAKHVRLSNGSEIKAVATSPDALRGYTPTIMVFDEAAFIEGGEALWTACLASTATGGNIILISTPNGLDPIYYSTYEGSINNTNSFKISHLKWWTDPRFNKDLKLIKTSDIINWIQKNPSERLEEIISADNLSFDDISELINKGYKPHSTWYENMCREMKLNKRLINQELECVIGDTLVTIRNIYTGVIEKIRVDELYGKL